LKTGASKTSQIPLLQRPLVLIVRERILNKCYRGNKDLG
jgi:hypothetical protein